MSVTVSERGADVGFDCAHGEITAPLEIESDGSFSLPGYYVLDAGPIVEGAPENRRPARYFGRVAERRLTLSFTLPEEDHTEGPFTAMQGEPARLRTCR